MKVVTLINEKGGVGKTTLSVHIAAGLAVNGFRAVIFDSDPQGHATEIMGLVPEPGLYDLIVRKAAFKDVLRIVPPELYEPPNSPSKGVLAMVPGNIETRMISGMVEDVFAIYNRLQELNDYFDVVIFDTAPTPSLLHGAIYLATDGIIYPTELSALSFHSLTATVGHRSMFAQSKSKMGYGDIHTMGIVPTKARLKTVEHQENLKLLQDEYGDTVWNPIGLSVTWEEAAMQRRPVFSYAPYSSAAKQAWRVVAQAVDVLQTLPE